MLSFASTHRTSAVMAAALTFGEACRSAGSAHARRIKCDGHCSARRGVQSPDASGKHLMILPLLLEVRSVPGMRANPRWQNAPSSGSRLRVPRDLKTPWPVRTSNRKLNFSISGVI